jgi:hypothetical protein
VPVGLGKFTSVSETQNHDPVESSAFESSPPVRSHRGRLLLIALVCAALVVGVGVFAVVHSKMAASARRQQASAAAARFLKTWADGDLSALPALTVSRSADITQAYNNLDLSLGIGGPAPHTTTATPAAASPIKVEMGTPVGNGDLITVPATVIIQVPGLGTWRDPITMHVQTSANNALIKWSPQTVAAALKTGDHILVTRTVPTRAAILGTDGQPVPAGSDVNALVGTTGAATAAQAEKDPTLRTGDIIGQSGLQASSDATLRGAASGAIAVVDPTGATVATLAHWAGRAPAPVSSTVNPTMQLAAAAAISNTGHPSALVAIDTTDGAVLAAASNPASYPRALLGQYPPGSTFKMVTLTAALMSGHTLSSPTSCSPTATVNGESFHNASGESFGTIPLLQAFAISCNTSFINMAETLPTGALASAAKLLGCDTGHAPLPVASYGCSYPATATGTAYAASAIGQGTVLASPLAIADIAAAADSGSWHQTHITPGLAPASHPLPAAVVTGLQTAMRAVVTSGTGTSANLPGTPIYGKTGTAEIGSGSNPPTDAWFAAYRGNVAVAVVVEDAGFGATAALPVVTRFLTTTH